MEKLKSFIQKFSNNEKGVSIIESLLIMASIAILVSFLSSWFQYFLSGSTEKGVLEEDGFINTVMIDQTIGLSETSDSITLIPGCDTSLVERCP